jgi:hypothetical protein
VKRSVAAVVGSALVAGAAMGAVAVSASNTPRADAGRVGSDLNVVSSWSGQMYGQKVRLYSGSLQGDPGHGFVLVEPPGEKPAFFSAPAGSGAFRLSSVSNNGWVFGSSRGALAVVGHGSPEAGAGPSFTFLGRRLVPAHLGRIGMKGVAVPVSYGAWQINKRRWAETAVVLVEQTDGAPGWKLDGYLPGFSLPGWKGGESELRQPLLGADGRLYRIDARGDRLVRTSDWRSSKALRFKFGCTTWPAPNGDAYRACQNSIVLHKAGGAAVTVFRRNQPKNRDAGWDLVQRSPDGKWLLLEDAFGACGLATWADFLPSRGGQLESAFPEADSSQALGWLPDSTALVAVQTTGCDGSPVGGVYQVWPGNWTEAPQLIFAADALDATTWGFGARPAR